MTFLGLITSFICFVIAFFSRKNKMSPIFVFPMFIGVVTFFANFRLWGLPSASSIVYLMILCGVVFFALGGSLVKPVVTHSKVKYTYKTKLLFVVVSLLLFWGVYKLLTISLPLLLMGESLNAVRGVYFGQEVEGISHNSWDDFIEIYLNKPTEYALIPIVAYEMAKKREDRLLSFKLMVMCIVLIILSTLNTGGRFMLVLFMLVIAGAFILRKIDNKKYHIFEKNKFKSKNKKVWLVVVVCILGYSLYWLSTNRTGEQGSYDFGKTIYMNYCGCIPHMSEKLIKIDYTYGATFLQGISRPFMLLYKYLLGEGMFPDFYQRSINISQILQSEVYWGDTVFNAYVMPFYYFYWDGGIVAVILESFVYGFFCMKIYVKRKLSVLYDVKYLLILLYLLASTVWFAPYFIYFVLAYFYINIFFKKCPNQ